MPRQSGFGWAWRVPLALAGSLAAATASGYLLTRGLPLDDPLERLYAGLFGALGVGLLLLVGGLLARDPATSPGAWAVACWHWAWRCGCWRGAVEVAARPLLLSLHGGAGALFGVLLFVVLFSGAWSLGHDDLREWLRAPAQAGGEALALERLLERAGEEGVDIRDATLLLPAPGHAAFSVCDARLDCRLDLDPASGRVLPPMPALDLLLNLHKSLFVGFPGRVLVSLFGVSLLLLCLAGVLLHSRRWRDLRRWRRDRRLRLALFDLHGLIGIWDCPGCCCSVSPARSAGWALSGPCCWRRWPTRRNRTGCSSS